VIAVARVHAVEFPAWSFAQALTLLALVGSRILCAVESAPVTVHSITSELTLMVAADLRGVPVPVRVQLAFMSLPDHPEQAQAKLAELCPVGCRVRLSAEGTQFASATPSA
jgi:hypothetical protein